MADERYATAAMAARVLADPLVTAAHVRRWVSAGWLTRAKTVRMNGNQATAVYDVLDLWKAYNRWRADGRRGARPPKVFDTTEDED